MSKVSVTKSKLDALATAVSVKSGVATPITIDEMTTAVANIQTGGNDFVVTLSWNDQTEMYEPDCTWDDVCDAYYAGKTVLTYNAEWMTGIYIEEFSFDPEWDKDNTVIWLDVIFWDDNDGKKYDGLYIWNKTEYILDANIEQIEPIFDSPSVTYTPIESQQTDTITYDSTLGYNGIEEVNVTVNAIPSNYIGSGVARKSSSDLTASGATVTAPAGYYSSSASKSVASGTAGTPTATKGNVSNHSVSITPSVTNTTGYITGSTKTGTAVTVSASELVSGNKEITSNGTNIDVANYSTVSVAVPGGGGSTKNVQAYLGYAQRTANSYGATNVTLTVSKTGTYTVSWTAWRSSSSGTMGTNLHIGSSSGTNQQTWTGTYGQNIKLTGQSLTQGTVITIYATSGSTSRSVYVGNLIIQEE